MTSLNYYSSNDYTLDYRQIFLTFPVVTRTIIAQWYGISRETLRRRINKLDIVVKPGLLYPKDVLMIISALGIPSGLQSFIIKQSKSTEKL